MKKLLLVVVLCLVLPASAALGEDITREPLIQRDLSAAMVFWHHSTRCRTYKVETGPVVGLAGTELFGCVQVWNAEVWGYFQEALHDTRAQWHARDPQSETTQTEYLRWSCVLTIHEMGHTFGLPDENRRGTIMYRGLWPGDSEVAPSCRRLFP